MKNYVSATGTVTQNGTPTPTNPIEPVFYTQGNMVLRKVGTYADEFVVGTGKNLWDEDWESGTITTETGTNLDNGLGKIRSKNYISVNPSTAYTLSQIGNGEADTDYIYFYNADKQFLKTQSFHHKTPTWSQTFYTTTDTRYIRFITKGTTYNNDIQVEKGSIATAYQPYTNTSKITRRVGVKVLNGTETGWQDVSYVPGYYYVKNSDMSDIDITANNGYCSHFSFSSMHNHNMSVNQYTTGTETNLNRIMFTVDTTDYPVMSDFKAWLASQYSAGTPVTVYYPLATPVTETWTETQYCENSGIKVATTKYVEDAFSDSITELNTTMGTIKNVVDNTIIQADRIGKLHTGKQNRPDEQCPKGRECLLIIEADGSLHWYPICDANGSVEPIED